MASLVDVHVLAQAVVYFLIALCGLAIAIPLGISKGATSHKGCLLYAEMEWKDVHTFQWQPLSNANCRYPMYLGIAGCVYGLFLGILYVYKLSRKDPNTGSQMWVWPYFVLNAASTVAFFIAACIVSVGFKTFCDNWLDGIKSALHFYPYDSCSDLRQFTWTDVNDHQKREGKELYYSFTVAMAASWVMVLLKLVQISLGILRLVRNRRMRAQGMNTGSGARPSDLDNVVAAET